ncbi:protein serine threonine phosphatase 2C [Lentinula detonsa]|uniref:Protein serine threonine phosphatase 2C n=1 Tax=Lentinula detonsa TaxID=2804962 RepID=A0AA38PW83_9AGAR|nr:protein serine threonine phosphatase 2C [Lentinula detonsa]
MSISSKSEFPPPSRSPSPEITVSPPSPTEESDVLAGSTEVAIEPPVGSALKNEAPQRKHTDMGWPSHDFTYLLLSEENASAELERLSTPRISFDGVHSASLQPHPEKHSQDRLIAQQWDLGERGSWRFRAVFDGHAAGDETVDYVFSTLPHKVRLALTALSDINVEAVSSLLRETTFAVDYSIKQGVLELFPSPDYIEQLSNEEIQEIVNDRSTSPGLGDKADATVPSLTGPTTLTKKYAGRGTNNMKITRAMRGTTVLIVLISPDGGMWTASLGDCQAVLGQKQTLTWTTTILSTNHNAAEPSEVARLKLEHPGEESVVENNRVLGLIAVTRAIGDYQFKLPSIYTKRVFALTVPGMNRPGHHAQMIQDCNLTPPYVSGMPDVNYVKLDGTKACLILCSDGLLDLYGGQDWQEKHVDIAELCKMWVELVGERIDYRSSIPSQSSEPSENLALFLLSQGLRGPTKTFTGNNWTDEEALNRKSSLLTLEFKDKWMDDTTVLVEVL